MRDRYGRYRSGQACLLARRLVEAGVPLITVFLNHTIRGQDKTPDQTDTYGWDTHNDIFEALKDHLLPRFDQTFCSAVDRPGRARPARPDAGGLHGRVRPAPASGSRADLRRQCARPQALGRRAIRWSRPGRASASGAVFGASDRHRRLSARQSRRSLGPGSHHVRCPGRRSDRALPRSEQASLPDLDRPDNPRPVRLSPAAPGVAIPFASAVSLILSRLGNGFAQRSRCTMEALVRQHDAGTRKPAAPAALAGGAA